MVVAALREYMYMYMYSKGSFMCGLGPPAPEHQVYYRQ